MQSTRKSLPVVLSVAGSDSCAGAGIQADLKTFAALGVYGTTAVTCVTAQNPEKVEGISPLDPVSVSRQIRLVCEVYPVAAAKTGMLYSADIIRAVADADVRQGIPILVVDPVMVSTTGTRLLQADAVTALCEDLLPQARVITPNLHEAEILVGHSISSVAELRRAAREIGDLFDVACVAKGGSLGGDDVVDVLYDEGEEFVFSSPRIQLSESHGAGCAFSAALAACLGKGMMIHAATERAKQYVSDALAHAYAIGEHRPLNHFHGVDLR